MDCLKIELMSSEESDAEEDELIVRPLSWRSADTNKFIELLDGAINKNKSKRQMKERITGPYSLREKPTDILPTWV